MWISWNYEGVVKKGLKLNTVVKCYVRVLNVGAGGTITSGHRSLQGK